MAVRVCLCVSVSTHRTSVGVHQHTQDVPVCPSAHTGRPWLYVCPCVSVSTHRTSVAVHQYTYQHVGPWTQHAGPSHGLFGSVCSVHTGRLWVSASTHMTSVAVRQYTQDVRGCPCVSVCVRVCLSAHTRRPWLSISTHISMLVLGLSTLAFPVDCSGDFGTRGLSVQYTQDVRGCPPAHTGRLWLSMAVRQHLQDVCGCPCVSVCVRVCLWASISTHRTYVAVHQYTYQHAGPWTQHAGLSRGLFE